MRRTLAGVGLAALLVGAGCAAGSYGEARLMDLTDVLDVKYGTGVGLGVRAEATMFLEAGLGYSTLRHTRESFGRRSATVDDCEWFYFVFFGAQGYAAHVGEPTTASFVMFFVNMTSALQWRADPPMLDRFRFGAEVVLPGVNGALFVNVGEIVDLVAGLFGADPAADDGLPKGASF